MLLADVQEKAQAQWKIETISLTVYIWSRYNNSNNSASGNGQLIFTSLQCHLHGDKGPKSSASPCAGRVTLQ